MSTLTRTQLHDWLIQLNASEFDKVLLHYPVPHEHIRREVSLSQQVGDVVRYAEQRDEFVMLLDAIRRVAPTLVKSISAAFDNPYKGLAAFREADKDLFFGRQREIAALLDLVGQQRLVAWWG